MLLKLSQFKIIFLGLGISLLLGFTPSARAQSDSCETHQVCKPDTRCECIVPATSAYERYFYIDFPRIQKGRTYHCSLSSSPRAMTLVKGLSTFPAGSTHHCTRCERFPIEFSLDTKAMTHEEDTLVLKYFVPGSDIPTQISASCRSE